MAAQSKSRSCPYCKEEIKADAVRCKHCRSALSPDEPEHGGTCPYCKEEIHPEAVKCKHCGSAVGPGSSTGGCEGCGESVDAAAFMAAAAGDMGGLGGMIDIDPDCASRLLRCNLECVGRYPRDPMMRQACRDSCRASYRLCRSFSRGGISFF
jgi:hypothetical protein